MEYIKLKSALKILDSVMSDEGIKHKGKVIRKRLNELPIADVVKVKHGEWKIGTVNPHNQTIASFVCTACRGLSKNDSNYCPNCGAKMSKKAGAEQ